MSQYFSLALIVLACTLVNVISFGGPSFTSRRSTTRITSYSQSSQCSRLPPLFAKKKPKLLSDDLLSSLDGFDESSSPVETPDKPVEDNNSNTGGKKDKKKDKKLSKFGISDDLLQSLSNSDEPSVAAVTVDEPVENSKESKKKNKNNKKFESSGDEEKAHNDVVAESETTDAADDDDDESASEKQLPADGLTVEQRVRKERPPSRIRFAESAQPDYVMMALEGVGLMYGNDVVLKDASFSVTTGERVGLVGPNGAGKTTQLRILSGDIEPTTGDVVKSSRNLRVAFLRQEFTDDLEDSRSLKEELFASFKDEQDLLNEIASVEDEVARTTDDPDKMEEVLNRLQKLQDKAISQGVYNLDSRVKKVMDACGFSSDDEGLLVKSFSGGWKMRIGIAKILLKEPNVLLLDEPTNHLDLDSVFWLEDFLQRQNLPMVIVSHDREFLDRVCNKIVDVEEGKTVSYQGNYSKFLEQRRQRLDIWRDQYEKQQRVIKEEEKWIKKAKNDPNMAQQVKAKETSLEKLKNGEDYVEQPPKDKKFRFRFPPAPRCGGSVVEGSKLGHGYGSGQYQVLFDHVDIQVDRGNRVGFVGPNGSGKSTMMRLIAGIEDAQKGYVEFGSGNVVANYYQQNQADAMDLDRTVLETVQEGAPSDYTFTEIRALLGQFMFKGDDVDKKLRVLSGGEKARVALCKMMLTPANLLLLDEPTNHLDITSKEVLEDALLNFEGTVLFISHDRYFMSQVANTIWEFDKKTVIRHDTDYHDFMNNNVHDLKEKVTKRYVEGDKYKITNAKEVIVQEDAKSKRNFGGSGVTSGNLNKGIKNAKRYQG